MSMESAEEIESAALNLNASARARLAEKLLRSLETLSSEEIEALWIEEAQRRDRELDSGNVEPRPAEEVFRDARSRLS